MVVRGGLPLTREEAIGMLIEAEKRVSAQLSPAGARRLRLRTRLHAQRARVEEYFARQMGMTVHEWRRAQWEGPGFVLSSGIRVSIG